MGVFDFLGAGKAIAAPIEAIGETIGKIYTTEGEKLSHAEVMERIAQNPQLWTFLLNQINAGDNKFFNSGWRPFIGWICGGCVGLYYIPQFIMAAYLWSVMCFSKSQIVPYPVSPDSLFQLVYLILGFGGYKTVETILNAKKTR